MKYDIPVYEPTLTGNEQKYVMDCVQSGWISGRGSYVQAFEEQFSAYTGVGKATTVSNGTVALHLALMALGIGPGDEVIVPTFTYIAPVNAIVYCGATPVFVDSRSDTWQVDAEDIRRRITLKTKAIIAVHLYGHPCEMDELTAIAREHRLFLLEDCAEAFGTLYKGKHVGQFGDISTFSFYGNKTITTGEGGMVVTNDETLYQRSLHLKGQGLAKYREYWHDVVGYNYRMTNICGAIGLAQLERADEFITRKRQIASIYAEMLSGTGFTPHHEVGDVFHSYWMCSVLTPQAHQRDKVREFLKQNGIETRPTFYPVHTMPMYSQKYERHAIAENIAMRGINLPSYPGLTDEQVVRVATALKEGLEHIDVMNAVKKFSLLQTTPVVKKQEYKTVSPDAKNIVNAAS
ncbi:MAG: DegT/DnrJ/EryC1/StrS aminotransferase family protein [Candidatus Kapaibacterium sp.]